MELVHSSPYRADFIKHSYLHCSLIYWNSQSLSQEGWIILEINESYSRIASLRGDCLHLLAVLCCTCETIQQEWHRRSFVCSLHIPGRLSYQFSGDQKFRFFQTSIINRFLQVQKLNTFVRSKRKHPYQVEASDGNWKAISQSHVFVAWPLR